MKDSYISGVFKYTIPEKNDTHKSISYSQYAMWAYCPRQWKLNYVDGRRSSEDSIHTLFGSAFHATLQHYLKTLYTESAKAADAIDLAEYLRSEMSQLYITAMEKNPDNKFTDKDQMTEFYADGLEILNYIKRHRAEYFSTKGYRLVAIEMPLYHKAVDINDNVFMLGFVDVILEDVATGTLIVYDIKTSTNGWNKYQKDDKVKTAQLIVYKKYISEQFNWPLDKISIRFFIVKRKLMEGFMYPQKRIQEFEPANGKPTVLKLMTHLNEFVRAGFNSDGTYKADGNFPAVAGKNNKHCKYCVFKDNEDLCSKKERIKE